MKPTTRTYSLAIALMAIMPAAYAAEPAETQWENDRFNINLGGFLMSRKTELRIDSKTSGRGTTINFEDDLGLDKDRNVVRADMYFRFNERHRIDAAYYDLSRDSTRVINEEIIFKDTVYPINATINSEFNFKIYKAAYTYTLVHNSKSELGLSAGLFVQDYNISLFDLGTSGAKEEANVTAPLPVAGLRGAWHLTDKWWLRGSVELFALDYDAYSGRLTDIIVSIEHNTFDNVGFGIGYNNTSFKITSDQDNFLGEVKLSYGGVLVYTKIHF